MHYLAASDYSAANQHRSQPSFCHAYLSMPYEAHFRVERSVLGAFWKSIQKLSAGLAGIWQELKQESVASRGTIAGEMPKPAGKGSCFEPFADLGQSVILTTGFLIGYTRMIVSSTL